MEALNKLQEADSPDEIPVWKKNLAFVRTERLQTKLENGLNAFGVLFILTLMFLTVCDIVARYVFNHAILGVVEISELMLAPLILFGLAYTQRLGGHVRMGLFLEKVISGRTYHIFELLIILMSLFIFIIITVFSFKNTIFSYQIGETTDTLFLPLWVSKTCIPVGAFLICLRLLIQLIQHLAQVLAGIENRNLN
jgi:TRAP-type C4-dicarboxylate transport system permease small subunit